MDHYEAQAMITNRNNSSSPTQDAYKTPSSHISIKPQASANKGGSDTTIAHFSKSKLAAASLTDSQVTFGAPEPTPHMFSPGVGSPKALTYNGSSYAKETPNNEQTSNRTSVVEQDDQESPPFDGSDMSESRKRRKAAIAGEQKFEEMQEKFPFRNGGSGKKRT